MKLDELLEHKRSLARDMLNGSGDIRPGEFGLEEVAPDGDAPFDEHITIDDVLQMRWDYFECLIAAIWQKKSYKRVYRTPQTDDGVDVVAISGNRGELLQCKSSGVDGADLSWEAVKDVVTGEAAYRMRHPGVEFQKEEKWGRVRISAARALKEIFVFPCIDLTYGKATPFDHCRRASARHTARQQPPSDIFRRRGLPVVSGVSGPSCAQA